MRGGGRATYPSCMNLRIAFFLVLLFPGSSFSAIPDIEFDGQSKVHFGDWLKRKFGSPDSQQKVSDAHYFQAMDKLYRETVRYDFKVASQTNQAGGTAQLPTSTISAQTAQGVVTVVYLAQGFNKFEWVGQGSEKFTYERQGMFAGGKLTTVIAY